MHTSLSTGSSSSSLPKKPALGFENFLFCSKKVTEIIKVIIKPSLEVILHYGPVWMLH